MGSHELRFNNNGTLFLRKSMVETYNMCPYKFKVEWIEGVGIEENYIMAIGTRFHEFAYWFFDVCQAWHPDKWCELVPSSFNDDEQDMVAWWIDQEYKRYWDNPKLFMPAKREIKLEDDKLCLSGTCDRLDWYDEAHSDVIIGEYKTGESFNLDSISRQLAYYAIIWNNTIMSGNIKYMRYINPRLKKYELIPFKPNEKDKVLINISKIRGAIKNDIFPRTCSERKHIICKICTGDECGAYK
jgi:hypothetical protein